MPAWGLTLTPTEVKDVAAFVRELGFSPSKFPVGSTIDIQKQLELGRVVYSLQCLSCHGRTGKGDGPLLQGLEGVQSPDFTAKSYFHNVTNAQLEEWAQSGAVHAKLGIDPTQHTWWHQGLDEKEVEAVLLYLRTLPLRKPKD
jgi:mono/diheme cytochrome c family protein